MREYVWLDDMPLAIVADVDTVSPKLWFVHADHLERPLKMTDTTKSTVWDALYRPFGEVDSITGTASDNLRFPGQYFLIEAGLHYNWHRHYDPTLGRYLQPDPLDFVDGPSIYAYASSQPTITIDPDGRNLAVPLMAICARYPAACVSIARKTVEMCLTVGAGILEFRRTPKRRRLDECLDACASKDASGGRAWRNFCNLLDNPAQRATCWSHQFDSEDSCRGYCFSAFGN